MESAQLPRLMIVDDEIEVLKALQRVLRKDYDIEIYADPNEALTKLHEFSPTLILSDMRMPQMDGATFLAKSRETCPESKRILLTGYADMESTVRAINEGAIYSYIAKPWNNEELLLTLKNAHGLFEIERQRESLLRQLKTSNDELQLLNDVLEQQNHNIQYELHEAGQASQAQQAKLKRTYNELISLLGTIISEAYGRPRNHSKRVASQARYLAKLMGLSATDQLHLHIAGSLYEIGKTNLVPELNNTILSKLDASEYKIYAGFAEHGAELLSNVPNFSKVASIIRYQQERVDGNGYGCQLQGEEIPIASKILAVCADFDEMVQGFFDGEIRTIKDALSVLQEQAGHRLDEQVVKVFTQMLLKQQSELAYQVQYLLDLSMVRSGSILASDALDENNHPMLLVGTKLTHDHIERLKEVDDVQKTVFLLDVYPPVS